MNGADIGWMILVTGMVLLMTPALAFFARGRGFRLGARRLLAGIRPRQRGDRRADAVFSRPRVHRPLQPRHLRAGVAALAAVNTVLAPMATALVWMLLDLYRTKRMTAVGAVLALGAIAALPSYYGIMLRSRTRLDDSLDVTAAHGLGGIVGALLTGVFARAAWGGADGLIAGKPSQVSIQAAGISATLVDSGEGAILVLSDDGGDL